MADAEHVNEWTDPAKVEWYLGIADAVPHREEGEGVLLDHLPERVDRFLDLGCGDGRLTALVRAVRPESEAVALDFSPAMLDAVTDRFADEPSVTVVAHDLDDPLPDLGTFDAVVSSFAVHHVVDERKRSLYGEVFDLLRPGGAFLNLEHVASTSDALHDAFLVAVGEDPEDDDPSNVLALPYDQVAWMADVGFVDADCHWKWLELALLAGVRPG